jgi:glycosyltransferase 2 family protein
MKGRAGLIALIISIAALVIVARQLDWAAVGAAWTRVVWPWVVVAAALNIINTWVEGLRWRSILAASDIRVPANRTFASMLIGTVGNLVLPLKLGEAARGYALARTASAPVGTVLSTVVLDRLVDTASVVPMLLLVAAVGLPGLARPTATAWTVGIAGLCTVALVATIVWRRFVARHGVGTGSRLAPHVEAFVRGFATLKQRHTLARALALGTLSWCTRSAVVWAMFPAFGLDWSPLRAVFTLVLLNLSIVVVATPGNVGTFELAASGILHYLGASPEVAVSLALALHLAEVVPTAALGALALWRFGIHLDRAALLSADVGPL